MKSMILIILSLFILSATHAANETAHQHTFLVKTDLTKEQVEALLNQHHQNKNQAETTNFHKKSNETEGITHLLVNETKPETTQLKAKKDKHMKKNKEAPEVPEVPEVENKTETETVSLKKKGKKEKNKKQEIAEIPEVKEVENKTNLLANETSVEEVGETETETEKITLVNKDISKQSGNKIFGFIFTILITIAFVSLIVYTTQPKKYKRQFNHNHSELTDYLLVKEN